MFLRKQCRVIELGLAENPADNADKPGMAMEYVRTCSMTSKSIGDDDGFNSSRISE
jgi:hypothetical protein